MQVETILWKAGVNLLKPEKLSQSFYDVICEA